MIRTHLLLPACLAVSALTLFSGCDREAPATQVPAGPVVRGEKFGPETVSEPPAPEATEEDPKEADPVQENPVDPGLVSELDPTPSDSVSQTGTSEVEGTETAPNTVESIDTRNNEKTGEEDWPLAEITQPEDKILPVPEIEGHKSVTLNKLADYTFSIKDDDAKIITGKDPLDQQIPEEIKKLNGKKIVTTGFMFPVDFKNGKTNKFMMIRVIPSCFYCRKPSFNEWVVTTTADGKRVEYLGDQLMQVTGTLTVGTERDEDGYVTSVYRLKADSIKLYEAK